MILVAENVEDSEEGRAEGTSHQNADAWGLHSEFVRSLQESYRNDRRPPDGLIYQKIRYYQGFLSGPRNKIAENQWWAALENVPRAKKRGYLRAFFRHPGFTQAFDALLPIEGIWADMSIGVLHKLKAMRCDEVGVTHPSHLSHNCASSKTESEHVSSRFYVTCNSFDGHSTI